MEDEKGTPLIDESKIINVFLLDCTIKGKSSGVMRFIDNMFASMKQISGIRPHLIRIVLHSHMLAFARVQPDQFIIETDMRLPILEEEEFIWKNIAPMFAGKQNIVFDLNLIDLIGLGNFLKRRTNGKLVSHLHCIPWHLFYENNKAKFFTLLKKPIGREHYYNIAEQHFYMTADKIIAVADSGANFIRQISGIKPIVVKNGIEDVMEEWTGSIPTDNIVVISVGGSDRRKGMEYNIEAAWKALRRGVNIKMLIAGAMPEKWQTEMREKFSGLDVTFGNYSMQELFEQYQSADLGLISSITEQTSYCAMEMMMFGLPIIAPDVKAFKEMEMKECALFVPVSRDNDRLKPDTNKMAEYIEELSNNKGLYKKMSIAARESYLEHYQSARMVNETIDVYRKLLKMD